MKVKVEQSPATNPNPILRVGKDCIVFYSNEAGEFLLREWGVEIGGKLPPTFGDLVQRVISLNSPEKLEIKVGNRAYLIVFHPSPEQECVNVSGFEISDHNGFEEKLQESERSYHLLFENMLDGFAYCKLLYDDCGHPVDFIYLDTNRAFEQLTGLKKVNGKRATEVIPGIKETHPDLLEIYCRVALTGKPEKFEIEFKPLGIWLSISVYSTEKEHFVAVFDNITESKLAERALQKSEEKYRIVANNTSDWEFWLDPCGRFQYTSPSCERVTGYAAQEFMDKPDLLQEIIHQDDRQAFLQHRHDMLSSRHGDIEFRIVTKNGEIKWIHHVCQSLYNGEGRYAGSRGSNRDITERKRAEAALLESEQHYRLLYETMLQGVVYQDASGKIISMNRAAEKILGKIPAEFLGSSSVGEEYFTIRENGSPFPGLEHPSMVSLRTGRKVQNVVMGVYNPREKRYRWININAVPIFRTGEDKPFQVYTLFDDITERKQAEEALAFERSQLLSIFDGIDDAVYVTDPYTYEILYTNKAMKEKFGGELVGGICYREFQEKDFPCDFCTNPIILKERDKPYNWEYYNPTVDRYFMIMDRIIKWPDDRDVRFEIAKDITDRKRAEEALRISEEKYRSLFNSIDEGFNIIEMIFDDSVKAVDYWILETNPSQEKMSGLKDVVGKRARELLPNFEDYWIESFGQVAITGEPVRLENRIEELDRWFDVYASRFGVEGSSKVAVVFNDITQRKKAEEALNQSEKRLNFALETIHTGAWDLDLVNHDSPQRSLEHDRIFGYEQHLPKWTYEMFLDHVLPEDRSMVDEKFQNAITSGGDWSFECRIRRVDGIIRWIWAAGRHQIDSTGSIRRIAGIVQDITERKRAEEALRESKERLRLLSDNLPDSAVYQYIHEPDGSVRFVYFSAGIEKLNNVKISDVLQYPDTLYRQIPPEYSERLVESEARSARELSDFDMELPMRLPGGQVKWMRLHSRPRRLPDGLTIWDGVQTDITKLKQAEEILRENESRRKVVEAVEAERRRLFDVLETLPVMISLLTPDHQIAFANRSFREKFGEPDGCHCYEHCFGSNQPCEFCKSYKVLETGQPQNWEVTTPDGSVIDVYSSPFTDVDGSPMILKMDIDITDRKIAEEKLRDSEEKYRNIVETANEGILITDKENIITYVNQKLIDMLGYKLENFIGNPIWGFISEEYIPIVKQNLEKRMQGISGSYELKLIHKDGSPLWTFLNAKPLLSKDGMYVGAMSMLTDITERKKAEELLSNLETARKKEIHHRIKNNLQVISSLLDLQAEKFRDQECIKDSEVLKAFRESKDRVISMALIHEELYKGEGFEKLNFSLYIQELAENLFQTYSLGDAEITLNMDLEENLFFDMDIAVPLGMIVNELVSNSLKHAFIGRAEGKIKIELSRDISTEFESEEYEITNFTLKISDNGVGIPELDIENLDSLGMQLVTSLVDQLEGKLELKSNDGTEFIIKFKVMGQINLDQVDLKS